MASTQAIEAEIRTRPLTADRPPVEHPVVAGVASGVLLWSAFPPAEWSWLAWIALVPLFWLVMEQGRCCGFTSEPGPAAWSSGCSACNGCASPIPRPGWPGWRWRWSFHSGGPVSRPRTTRGFPAQAALDDGRAHPLGRHGVHSGLSAHRVSPGITSAIASFAS